MPKALVCRVQCCIQLIFNENESVYCLINALKVLQQLMFLDCIDKQPKLLYYYLGTGIIGISAHPPDTGYTGHLAEHTASLFNMSLAILNIIKSISITVAIY